MWVIQVGHVEFEVIRRKDFLQNKWKYELTMHFKHEMIGKHFTETWNKVEFPINCVRINRARPVKNFPGFEVENSGHRNGLLSINSI